MRKICLVVILVISFLYAHAQNFEGTLKLSIKAELNDPELKEKMDKASQLANSPDIQQQIRKLEEQLKDPQYQKAFEQNPAIKTQMEATLETLKNVQKNGASNPMANQLSQLMPKNIIIKLKNENSLVTMEGGSAGAMLGDILYLKEKNIRYSIKRAAKTYSVIPEKKDSTNKKEKETKVTRTDEFAKIYNYNCRKYLVETIIKDSTFTQVIWATTEIKGITNKTFTGLGASANSSEGQIDFSKIDGVPLKLEITNDQLKIVMEVVDIKKEKIDAATFTIPADFKEVKTKLK